LRVRSMDMNDFLYSNGTETDFDEQEEDRTEDEIETSQLGDETEASRADMEIVLDWVELEGALENNSPELHSFLNSVSGDVIRVFRGSEDADERLREVESSSDFLYIEPISSREQYRWMEEFIETVEEPNLKDKLNIAIDGKGAFRRFKDVLVGYPSERERWFALRSSKLRDHMAAWLAAKGVAPTNPAPWDEEHAWQKAEQEEEGGSRPARSDTAVDLRKVARDLVDLVPSRELPTAVAFLEFLRSRRGFRRPRYG